MRKAGRRIWIWILSGLAVVFGINCCNTAKLYGPPQEELYGPPAPKIEADTTLRE